MSALPMTSHSNMKRIEDYQKRLPVLEVYRCVQSEGSRFGRPTIAIRTTGCTHRCYFGEDGGWCDSWYTSIHPEKGTFCFQDIVDTWKFQVGTVEFVSRLSTITENCQIKLLRFRLSTQN